MKYKYTKKIQFEDVDLNYQLRIDVLSDLLQQIAAQHSESLGWGEEQVKSLGITWVLNTLKIEILKNPSKEDLLTIETWSRKVEGFKGLREFKVYKDNELIINASSVWLTIDFNKRRLIRAPAQLMEAYPNLADTAVTETADQLKIQPPLEYQFTYPLTVRHSDIDTNQHINSSRYFDYLDTALYRFYQKTTLLKEVVMQFKKEITPDIQEITIHLAPQGDRISFKIATDNDIHALGECQISL